MAGWGAVAATLVLVLVLVLCSPAAGALARADVQARFLIQGVTRINNFAKGAAFSGLGRRDNVAGRVQILPALPPSCVVLPNVTALRPAATAVSDIIAVVRRDACDFSSLATQLDALGYMAALVAETGGYLDEVTGDYSGEMVAFTVSVRLYNSLVSITREFGALTIRAYDRNLGGGDSTKLEGLTFFAIMGLSMSMVVVVAVVFSYARNGCKRQAHAQFPDDVNEPEEWDLVADARALVRQLTIDSKIAALPTRVYKGPKQAPSSEDEADEGSDTTEACAICLADFEVGDELRVLPCSHNFHVKCIDPWLQTKDRCPLCTRDVFADDDGDGDGEEEQVAGPGQAAEEQASGALSPPVVIDLTHLDEPTSSPMRLEGLGGGGGEDGSVAWSEV